MNMANIDLDELAKQIRKMSTRSQLYKTLKHELTAKGHWKNKPRGKATAEHFKTKNK